MFQMIKKQEKTPVELKPLGLYIHVPFCRSKCEYCDFYSLGGGLNNESMDLYLQAILPASVWWVMWWIPSISAAVPPASSAHRV